MRYQAVFLADRFISPLPQSASDWTTLRNLFQSENSGNHILCGDTEDLRKALNQVRSQGYFNKEYNYALRRKEAFDDFVRRIESDLNDPDNVGDEMKCPKTLNYEPMIEGSKLKRPTEWS